MGKCTLGRIDDRHDIAETAGYVTRVVHNIDGGLGIRVSIR
jgi:hypothetical protein